jgi:hypothetical protein
MSALLAAKDDYGSPTFHNFQHRILNLVVVAGYLGLMIILMLWSQHLPGLALTALDDSPVPACIFHVVGKSTAGQLWSPSRHGVIGRR